MLLSRGCASRSRPCYCLFPHGLLCPSAWQLSPYTRNVDPQSQLNPNGVCNHKTQLDRAQCMQKHAVSSAWPLRPMRQTLACGLPRRRQDTGLRQPLAQCCQPQDWIYCWSESLVDSKRPLLQKVLAIHERVWLRYFCGYPLSCLNPAWQGNMVARLE